MTDFIIDNMRFSYSNISSFDNCNYGWKLTYLDREDREGNFFSDYGSFCHLILEKYFTRELEVWDLEDYYVANYSENITHTPPPIPPRMGENYYNQGLDFFTNFSFDINAFEVIAIEDTIDSTINGIKLVVKPDLILREKSTGKYILYDYKTAKINASKMKDYKKQMYLYAYFYNIEKDIAVEEIRIWFVREQKIVNIPIDYYHMDEVIDWFTEGIKKITKETEWKANNTESNKYFCLNLCSVSVKCPFKPTL